MRNESPTILKAEETNPIAGGPSFALRNRVIRLLWRVVWFALASWSPPQFRGWRRLILRAFGAQIAPTADIYSSVRIWLPSNLEMGEYSNLGPGVNCYSMDKITLAAYASVSQGAHLCTGTHDIDDRNFQLVTKPIVIGENAWVAAEAFVGPGVRIGEGAVLGARAVTFTDLEANMIYIGNPAKPIRRRWSDGGA
jgi:putative colanic acid biosynthesis acetyltransferase WcaF